VCLFPVLTSNPLFSLFVCCPLLINSRCFVNLWEMTKHVFKYVLYTLYFSHSVYKVRTAKASVSDPYALNPDLDPDPGFLGAAT
jgi:hypothetical protein